MHSVTPLEAETTGCLYNVYTFMTQVCTLLRQPVLISSSPMQKLSGPKFHVRTSEDAPGPRDFSIISDTSFQWINWTPTLMSFVLINMIILHIVNIPCMCGIYCTSLHPRERDTLIEAVVPVPSKANTASEWEFYNNSYAIVTYGWYTIRTLKVAIMKVSLQKLAIINPSLFCPFLWWWNI